MSLVPLIGGKWPRRNPDDGLYEHHGFVHQAARTRLSFDYPEQNWGYHYRKFFWLPDRLKLMRVNPLRGAVVDVARFYQLSARRLQIIEFVLLRLWMWLRRSVGINGIIWWRRRNIKYGPGGVGFRDALNRFETLQLSELSERFKALQLSGKRQRLN